VTPEELNAAAAKTHALCMMHARDLQRAMIRAMGMGIGDQTLLASRTPSMPDKAFIVLLWSGPATDEDLQRLRTFYEAWAQDLSMKSKRIFGHSHGYLDKPTTPQ
jgi:hypothetical protein